MMGAGAFNTSKIIAKIHLFLNTTKLFVEKSGKTKEKQINHPSPRQIRFVNKERLEATRRASLCIARCVTIVLSEYLGATPTDARRPPRSVSLLEK